MFTFKINRNGDTIVLEEYIVMAVLGIKHLPNKHHSHRMQAINALRMAVQMSLYEAKVLVDFIWAHASVNFFGHIEIHAFDADVAFTSPTRPQQLNS